MTQKKSEPSIDVASKKSGESGGSWIFRAIAALAVFWLISSESGGKFLNSIFGSFGVETDIAKYDCEKVSALSKGETLQNAFGGNFEIITISAVTAVSKTSAKIVCNGEMGLSNGTTQLMRMSVEKGAGASEILYRAEPL